MKIVCEACQARYRIPDERVSGKKLRIRCRRCGGAILLRGDQTLPKATGAMLHPNTPSAGVTMPPPVEAMRPSHPPAAVEWYVSVDGSERGPLSTGQIAAELQAGVLSADAYAFRDGFEEWVPVLSCPELTGGAAQAAGPSAPPPPTLEDQPTQMFQSGSYQPVSASHAPASAPAPRASVPPASHSAAPVARHSSPPLSSQPSASAAPSPRVQQGASMTGERHENSVLFSASHLENVRAAASSPSTPGMKPAGYAGGDASGLIDIRALASMAKQTSTPPAAVPPGLDAGRSEDEVQLVHSTGAYSGLDSLAPTTNRPNKGSGTAMAVAVVLGIGMLSAAAVAIVWITRGGATPEPVVAVAAAVVPAPEPAKQAAPAVPAGAVAPAPEPAKQAAPAPDEVEAEAEAQVAAELPPAGDAKPSTEPEVVSAAPARRPASKRKKAARRKASRPKAAAAAKVAPEPAGDSIDDLLKADAKPEPEPEPAPAPEPDLLAEVAPKKPAEPQRDRSIDELLSGAVDDSKKQSAGPALPEQPGRDAVLKAIRSVEPGVRQCAAAEGVTGTAKVAITVAGSSGRVTGANVNGVTGSAGSCIARAVRTARFPKFSKATFKVTYPFRFK